jgi:hypothetical protein
MFFVTFTRFVPRTSSTSIDVSSQGSDIMVMLKLILSLLSEFVSSMTVEYTSGDMYVHNSMMKSVAMKILHGRVRANGRHEIA